LYCFIKGVSLADFAKGYFLYDLCECNHYLNFIKR
jgi:hypothetical protein